MEALAKSSTDPELFVDFLNIYSVSVPFHLLCGGSHAHRTAGQMREKNNKNNKVKGAKWKSTDTVTIIQGQNAIVRCWLWCPLPPNVYWFIYHHSCGWIFMARHFLWDWPKTRHFAHRKQMESEFNRLGLFELCVKRIYLWGNIRNVSSGLCLGGVTGESRRGCASRRFARDSISHRKWFGFGWRLISIYRYFKEETERKKIPYVDQPLSSTGNICQNIHEEKQCWLEIW